MPRGMVSMTIHNDVDRPVPVSDRNLHETLAGHCKLQDYIPGRNGRSHRNKQFKKQSHPLKKLEDTNK